MRWLLISMVSLALPSVACAADFAVVVARNSPLQVEDSDRLTDIFLRKRAFEAGISLVPVNILGDHPARFAFESQVLHMDREQLNRYWITSHFHGLSPPTTQASPEAIKRFIASVEGAIGYLPIDMVDGELKVLYEF